MGAQWAVALVHVPTRLHFTLVTLTPRDWETHCLLSLQSPICELKTLGPREVQGPVKAIQ